MKPPVFEIEPPDLGPWRTGNTGTAGVWRFTATAPGRHVLLTALIHGNELCGAIALDWLFRHEVKPLKGKLSLGFMNVAAYLSFDPKNPTASRFVDEDFNRLWTAAVLDNPQRKSAELTRARAVRPYIDTVDLLLDIHSMQRRQPAMMM